MFLGTCTGHHVVSFFRSCYTRGGCEVVRCASQQYRDGADVTFGLLSNLALLPAKLASIPMAILGALLRTCSGVSSPFCNVGDQNFMRYSR